MKVVTFLIGLMLVCGFVYGDTTARGLYSGPNDAISDWLNTTGAFAHTHDYNVEKYKPQPELGVGIDAVIWNNDVPKLGNGYIDEILIENRYDFNNQVYCGYAVAKVDVSKAGHDLMIAILR